MSAMERPNCGSERCSSSSSSSSSSSVVETILSKQDALVGFIMDHCKGPTGSSMRNWALYMENLRAFITGKLSKAEFDHFVLSELACVDANEQLVHLHNAYIMSILVSKTHHFLCGCFSLLYKALHFALNLNYTTIITD